jgi:hypothetical protein
VVALAAVEVPRYLKARASGDQASTNTTTAANSSVPAAGPNASATPSAAAAPGSAQPGGELINPSSNSLPGSGSASPGGAIGGTPSSDNPVDQDPSIASSAPKKSKTHGGTSNLAAGDQSLPSSPGTSDQPSNPAPGAGGGNPPAAQPGGNSSANAQELQELGDLHDKLAARAQAANDSVESLRKQMAAGGNNLRSDISASQSRMKNYMGRFEAALNSGDSDSAKKYMSLAEHEVDKLEAFLGH